MSYKEIGKNPLNTNKNKGFTDTSKIHIPYVQLTFWDWIETKNKQVKQTSNNEVSND